MDRALDWIDPESEAFVFVRNHAIELRCFLEENKRDYAAEDGL
jgi:hypothetical protein